tara:strand:+ start:1162 stop:1365 length:204 start_codon:yes stop_codon:yes gene_type:complete
MNFINEIIYEQNLELLSRISNDMFDSNENRKMFIEKYHKKNFSFLKIVKKNPVQEHNIKFERIMRTK